jgi:hypothetical protein
MLPLGTQGQLAWIARRFGTERASRTGQAIGFAKLDANDLRPSPLLAEFPFATRVSLWTGHALARPRDLKAGRIKALSRFGLPTGVDSDWPDDPEAILLLTVD